MAPLILLSCGLNAEGAAYTGPLSYVHAIASAGGHVVVVPPHGQSDDELERLCGMADAVLLPGGIDLDPVHFGQEVHLRNGSFHPDVDAVDLYLARYALRAKKAVLGICRGCQVLAVAAGGSLYQDLPSQWRQSELIQHRQQAPRWHGTHQVTVTPNSLLQRILQIDNLYVNSFHHQAVAELPARATVGARSNDGVVEAIEFTDHPFALGIQWHPEGMVERDPLHRRIFTAFIAAATS
jgi:putative glutamine amidotransferase